MPSYPDHLHVAVAVIFNDRGEVLIARRAEHLHQGGLWEFPGGKVEALESVQQALRRELDEELGITPCEARPLIRIPYQYPDRKVLLDVWRVTRFDGEAHGREGQAVAWVKPEALPNYAFPAANHPIMTAARLPDRYLITPEPGPRKNWRDFLLSLERSLDSGIRLVQYRAKGLAVVDYTDLAREVVSLCRERETHVLLNSEPERVLELGADGVHLTGTRLGSLTERPLPKEFWVAASCHTEADLALAAALSVDFAVLSPVKWTASHPESEPMGWERFHALTDKAGLPVFALGGVSPDDLEEAWVHGAQGISAIRGLWKSRR